ncbi:MAG: sugar O-acetyltransferase [Paludibacteraceae bacterium]|nr:sugar O-acetyltransferase [Paludibacteraceae bacterium]
MTEKEKMLAGIEHDATDPQLLAELNAMKELVWEYNQLRPSMMDERRALISRMLGKVGKDFLINQPFYCDYGSNIEVGDNFFSNFNFVVLDEAKVTIGDNCFIAPNVSIYTVGHPIDPVRRNAKVETALPVTIGNNVWIGGSVTILPGVTIGNNVTIGAGSVVVRNIPDNCVAVGNPCKPIKQI